MLRIDGVIFSCNNSFISGKIPGYSLEGLTYAVCEKALVATGFLLDATYPKQISITFKYHFY